MGQGSDPGRDPRPNADYLERQEVAFCIQGGGRTSKNANGSGWDEEVCFTLNAVDVHGVAYEIHNVGKPSQ